MRSLLIALLLLTTACAESKSSNDTYGLCSTEIQDAYASILSRNINPTNDLIKGIRQDVEMDNHCYMPN